MNIYEFFNSYDIAEHCKKIGHHFTAIETAYLVWYSDHHTIAQKHAAWNHIIETMQDEVITTQFGIEPEQMLHDFLRKYMTAEKRFVKDFVLTKPGYIYSYEVRCREWDNYRGDGVFFDSYEAAIEAAKEDIIDEQGGIVEVRVIRRVLNKTHMDYDFGKEILVLTPTMEPLHIDEANTDGDYIILGVCEGFYDMWVEIPTPFKMGDIVCVHSTYEEETPPMCVAWLPYWIEHELGEGYTKVVERLRKSGDWSDMQAGYWEFDSKGDLRADHGPEYLSLEFYRGELKGRNRFLIALKNYLQKRIYIDDLIRSYAIFANEERAEYHRGCSGKIDEIKYLSGLLYSPDENEKTAKVKELIAKSDKSFEIGDKDRAIAYLCQAANLSQEIFASARGEIDQLLLEMEQKLDVK